MKTPTTLRWISGLALALSLSGAAMAIEVGGLKFDDTVKVGGKELKLNGAGIRTRIVIKVYALALYLPEKKDTTVGVLESAGPRRFTLGLLREVTGDELGQAFMAGITANTDKAERSRFVNQLAQFGEAFVNIPQAKKGDMITVDWIPDTGTVMHLNGKPIGEPLKDVGFYNAVLKIWLGDKPVDSSLKPQLLGKG
ncbi:MULTISPECIES: chalcone isomerase family protein [Roseateles]|uniref:Chalcone isomerase family protein n=1 Tax=Pelomonas caseinilytica TaxID=2906763 RepID=A0ABS8XES8_9BURK|nr:MULTISPECIES: chalcone isomerase family protein [unclassified Roseateles]MCE4537453.1 chalcone isomerase family protein [Pelomonas sp. P7]HEV6968877.1 chalcone isomerase family protein [Roseateles sp.]